MSRSAIASLLLWGVRSKDFRPYSFDYGLQAPAALISEYHDDFSKSHGVFGLAVNGIPFMSEHYEPDVAGKMIAQTQVLEFDNCGGHGDGHGHYHYHLAPLCLMRSLGSNVPSSSDWWVSNNEDTWEHWPARGFPVRLGTALDGLPIYGPYDPRNGDLLRSPANDPGSPLDECHGMRSKTGEYMYFLTSTPPFLPPCLRHRPGVLHGFFKSNGVHCDSSHQFHFSGCPNHPWYEGVSKALSAATGVQHAVVPPRRSQESVQSLRGGSSLKFSSQSYVGQEAATQVYYVDLN